MSESSNELLLTPAESVRKGGVLLLHGLTGNIAEVEDLANHLYSKGYIVLVPRLPGHGSSIEKLAKTSLKEFVLATNKSFDKLAGLTDDRVIIGGLSFGSLLAAELALFNQQRVKSLMLFSPPMRLRSTIEEFLLFLLSFLPDAILNQLWIRKKKERSKSLFIRDRGAYDFHAIGAVARMVALRRRVRGKLSLLSVPTLVVFDPADHHTSEEGFWELKSLVNTKQLTLVPIVGGEHEITVGPKFAEVLGVVDSFLEMESR